MITNAFFSRDQSIAKVNMAMNYLSRVVRENMVLFDFDARTNKASFLTESNLIVDCVVAEKGNNVFLEGITVNDSAELYSDESVDGRVNESVHSFVASLRNDDYTSAEGSFSDLLNAFQSRSQVNEVRAKLERRMSSFSDTQNITESSEYIKLQEIRDKVVEYLKEQKDTLLSYEDIANSLKLSNALGKAFNTPKKTWDALVSEGSVTVPLDEQKTVFEMVCAQELIRSELHESKENFSRSWVKNDKISKLASCIYNNDDVVMEALRDAITAVPYLALASKSDIKTVFASIYESSDVANISQKDIREYVARIFEFKKPIKRDILSELNEAYGINVQNLKFVPTFSNLAKAQSVFFEALGAVSEKDSVVRDVFESFSKALRKKGGIQALEVNDFIFEAFKDAGIEISDTLFKDMNLDAVVEGIFENKDKGYPEKGIKGGTKAAKKEEEKRKKKDDKEEEVDVEEAKKLDPVGQEDGDVDNDGDEDETDDYLKNRRDAVSKAIGKKKAKKKSKMADDSKANESVEPEEEVEPAEGEEEEPEVPEEQETSVGLGDDEMTELMGELESLFQEIDWDSLVQSKDEEGEMEEPEEEAPQSSM